MDFSRVLVCCTIIACFLYICGVRANCVCNEKGIDFCNKDSCKGAGFIRPSPRFCAPAPPLDLTPIGDSCACNKVLVEPALLPKPCPKHKSPKHPNCNCPLPPGYYPPPQSADYSSAPLPPVDYPAPQPPTHDYPAPPPPPGGYAPPALPPAPTDPYYYPPAPPPPCGCGHAEAPPPPPPSYDAPNQIGKGNAMPADPISISLALQANKAVQVPEAKLAFGFAQKPLDGLKKIYFSNVPEENLFKLNGEVITFAKPNAIPSKPEEEELPEEEEEQPVEAEPPPLLTYKQLGYVPEQFRNPKFRQVAYAHASSDVYDAKPVHGKCSVDCGFRPGRIAEYIKRKYKPADYY